MKMLTKAILELIQALLQLTGTAAVRIVHRPTPEGRKASAENHAGIEQVCVGHDTLTQAGDGLVDQTQDQAIADLRFGERHRPALGGLDRTAVAPDKKALARLAAEVTRFGHFPEARWHRILQCLSHLVGNRQADVQAHGVGQFDRPHRHTKGDRGTIDQRGRNAFVQQLHGLEQIGHEDPVDQDTLAVSWEKAMPNLANAIKLDYASQKFIFIIILLIVTIGVINTLLMSVMERMREFGVILALGSKPMTLRGLIILEAVIMGLLAATIGTVLGSLATWYLVAVGIDLAELVPDTLEFGGVVFDPVMRASWDPAWMIRIAVYVVCLTLAAAAYPAIKAGRTTPVEGMRHH